MSKEGERVKAQSPDLKSEEDWSETSGTVSSMQLEELALPMTSRRAREGERRRDRREKTSGGRKEKEKQKRSKMKVSTHTPRVTMPISPCIYIPSPQGCMGIQCPTLMYVMIVWSAWVSKIPVWLVCYAHCFHEKKHIWWGQTSYIEIPGQRCFGLISSHQQGMRTACPAHHRSCTHRYMY